MRPTTSRRVVGAVTLAGLVGAAIVGPSAAVASAATPAKLGIHASVPLGGKDATVLPGQRISVRVSRSAVRGTRVVRVSLAREAASGRIVRRVGAGRTRHGRIVVRVPVEDGARLRLTVRTGAHRYRVMLRTPPAAPSPMPFVPVKPVWSCSASGPPNPRLPSPEASNPGVPTASLVLSAAVLAPGEALPASLTNTTQGTQCLSSDWGHVRWEQLVDGQWVAPPPYPPGVLPPATTLEIWMIAPGESKQIGVTVPLHFPPGRYRYVADLTARYPPTTVTATAELEVRGLPGSAR